MESKSQTQWVKLKSNKTSHKELKYLLYDRGILHSNSFELIGWEVFEHMTTRVP